MKPTGKINPATGQPYRYGDVPDLILSALEGIRGMGQYQEPGTEGRPDYSLAERLGEHIGDAANRALEDYSQWNEKYGWLGEMAYPIARPMGFIGEQAEGLMQHPPSASGVGDLIRSVPHMGDIAEYLGGTEGRKFVFGEPGQEQAQGAPQGPMPQYMQDALYGPGRGAVLPSGVPMYLAQQEEPTRGQQPLAGGGGGGGPTAVAHGAAASPKSETPPRGLFELYPEQQRILEQYGQLGEPPAAPRPESGEQLLRVLQGLAGGAANYQPGPGGVARAIAGAGAGGLGQQLGYQAEMRQADYADQQAQREFNTNKIILQSQMQDQAAKMNLMQQEILSREAMAKLRARAQYARAWAKQSEIKAVATPYGTWFYNNSGGREFVDASQSPGFIITQAKNLNAAGAGAGDQIEWITNQMIGARDVPEQLKVPYTVASLMIHFGMGPELTNQIEAELEDSDPRYQTAKLGAIQGKPGAAAQADAILAHGVMSYFMQHPDEMEKWSRQIGDPGSFGYTPFERGVSEILGRQGSE